MTEVYQDASVTNQQIVRLLKPGNVLQFFQSFGVNTTYLSGQTIHLNTFKTTHLK